MLPARLLLAALSILACGAAHASDPPIDPGANADIGKHIYREGLLPSGKPLRGVMQNGAALNGADAACVRCHRRSGLGGGEGQTAVRPITGRLLFDPPALPDTQRPAPSYGNTGARPAYSKTTLARALREGVDPAGRTFDALMPRFDLSDEEIAPLVDYLEQLGAESAPGVTGSDIHFATIVAPGVPATQEQAMLDMLRAFFGDMNADTRLEKRRKAVGREQMYSYFRSWKLHVWKLGGPPDTWKMQLDEHYRRQPVFALLSGIGTDNWQPVHEFCEHHEVPCLFPNTGVSVVPETGYASFYFSRGAALEAEVAAKHLADAGHGGNIVQVFRDAAAGRALAQAMRTAMQRRNLGAVIDRPLTAGQQVPESFWQTVLDEDKPATLVLWLSDADLGGLFAGKDVPHWLHSIYLSANLAVQPGPAAAGNLHHADGWLEKIRLVYPYELPDRRAQRLARMQVWLRARNVPLTDERIQANTYFAATLAGDALAHMGGNFSRDYFIERVERMTEQMLFSSLYPRLSLGPGQRFASKGEYVARFAGNDMRITAPLSVWIVP
jgi:mono/diheme cytochrome c family protein